MTQNDFYGGFTSELVEPVEKDGLRNVIRHIHCCISEDKPIKGMYRDYLLDALDKIAKGSRCLVPLCDGVAYSALPTKEELWDKYYTGAPQRQRQCVERYNIVKRA